MSFQDVGKPGSNRRPNRAPFNPNQPSTIPERAISEASLPNTGDGFARVSDGILQYQKNLGILERIAKQMGTSADGPVLQNQYETQVDVLKQLGMKLEDQLKILEVQLEDLPRTEASKRRATHLKLHRDFRRVENTYRNVVLECRKKQAKYAEQMKHQQQNQQQNQQQRYGAGTDGTQPAEEEERVQLELQLQQNRLNEEIMREREEEIRNINRGMHQVNEIYKDLAHIVGSQQEQVDQIETQMEASKVNAEQGLTHIQKANAKSSSSQCTIS